MSDAMGFAVVGELFAIVMALVAISLRLKAIAEAIRERP